MPTKPREMAKEVDFQKVRKRRQRTQTVKRLIALCVILAAMGGIVVLNRYLIDAEMPVRVSDFMESLGGAGYPIPVPGGIIRNVKSMGSDLAVLNDTNLYIYTKNGKTIQNLQEITDSSTLVISGDRALIYETNGKRYRICSHSRVLLDRESDVNLLGADLNENGEFALLTASERSSTRVVVFDKQFNQMFELFSENLIADVSINPRGNRMAVVGIHTVGGQELTLVQLFDFSVDHELVGLEFPGEIPMGVQYLEDGRFSVLTNKQYRIFNSEGILESNYDYSGNRLVAIERQGRNVLLVLRESDDRLVLLDSSCKVLATLTLEERMKDVALNGSNVYLLTDAGITTFSYNLEVKSQLEMRGITDIHLVGSTLYYFGREEIYVLDAA